MLVQKYLAAGGRATDALYETAQRRTLKVRLVAFPREPLSVFEDRKRPRTSVLVQTMLSSRTGSDHDTFNFNVRIPKYAEPTRRPPTNRDNMPTCTLVRIRKQGAINSLDSM